MYCTQLEDNAQVALCVESGCIHESVLVCVLVSCAQLLLSMKWHTIQCYQLTHSALPQFIHSSPENSGRREVARSMEETPHAADAAFFLSVAKNTLFFSADGL